MSCRSNAPPTSGRCCRCRQPHSPHIVGRDRRYSIKGVAVTAYIGARHYTPCATVPVLHQRQVRRAVQVIPHSPYIAGRNRGYSYEEVVACARIGAGDDDPRAAVPMLYQRLGGAAVVVLPQQPTHCWQRPLLLHKSWLWLVPTLGLGTTLHVVPFQCSTSVWYAAPLR